MRNGPVKIVLIQAGKYEYAEVELTAHCKSSAVTTSARLRSSTHSHSSTLMTAAR